MPNEHHLGGEPVHECCAQPHRCNRPCTMRGRWEEARRGPAAQMLERLGYEFDEQRGWTAPLLADPIRRLETGREHVPYIVDQISTLAGAAIEAVNNLERLAKASRAPAGLTEEEPADPVVMPKVVPMPRSATDARDLTMLFHRARGLSKDAPDYDKDAWQYVQRWLERRMHKDARRS